MCGGRRGCCSPRSWRSTRPDDRYRAGTSARDNGTIRSMDDVLAKVQQLVTGIAGRAPTCEADRRLPAETVAELADAGVFRMLAPRRHGGLEADPRHFYDVVRTIAGACASTGWVAAVVGVNLWHVALFSRQAQDDLRSDGPEALVCSSYAPSGRFTPVDGGFELSGHWRFASACDHASWALLGGLVMAPDGHPVDLITALVPRADYRIDDVWEVVGLRGTGSNDLHADRIFVPSHRTLRNYQHALLRTPGQKVNKGPLYRMPFGAVFTSAVTAPLIGVVEGCLEDYLADMRGRNQLSFGGSGSGAADQFAHVSIGRAASEIDAAALQLQRNIGDLYECACRGEEIPMELRLRARRDQACGTERAVRAIDALFTTARSRSLRCGSEIERAWRDVHTGSLHLANDVDHALSLYGKAAFGLHVEDTLV